MSEGEPAKRQKLGEILIAQGKINFDQLVSALEKQEKDGGLLGEILIQEEKLEKEAVEEALELQKEGLKEN